jgi:cell wall-associated NlpC family hydrolase
MTQTRQWQRQRVTFRFAVLPLWLLCLMAIGAGFAVPITARISKASVAVVLPVELAAHLKAGDLIFRVGSGWQSEVVRGMARVRQKKRGDPYSHVGMLVGSPDHWQVLHAVPAEAPERADAVVRDDLDFFLAPERTRSVAIYRISAADNARAAAVEHALQRLGTPFRIVENDREGQYCTTLVWYAWQRAGVDLGARFEHLEVPLAEGDYLLPHDLRIAPGLQLLFETSANKSK